jgi:hypothetical protein
VSCRVVSGRAGPARHVWPCILGGAQGRSQDLDIGGPKYMIKFLVATVALITMGFSYSLNPVYLLSPNKCQR